MIAVRSIAANLRLGATTATTTGATMKKNKNAEFLVQYITNTLSDFAEGKITRVEAAKKWVYSLIAVKKDVNNIIQELSKKQP